jgi:hypothetical protein
MWCSNCGQDVPGIASKKAKGQTVCARCGVPLRSGEHHETHPVRIESSADLLADGGPPWELDDWQLDEELRTADRLVRETNGQLDETESPGVQHTVDAYHEAVRGWHAQLKGRPVVPDATMGHRFAGKPARPRLSLLSWSAISLGLMALVCGGVLLIWGYLFGRGELWSLGLPIALGGQAVLILGVFLYIDGLWQTNRKTSESLEELDESVADLRHATSMMSTTHSGPAQSFYAHMAEGASPELLLADLKGQMDILTMRLARQR